MEKDKKEKKKNYVKPEVCSEVVIELKVQGCGKCPDAAPSDVGSLACTENAIFT